jgi:hypothetical protein
MRNALITVTVTLALAYFANAAEPATRPTDSAAAIARSIANLASDDFAIREAATAALLKAGKAAEQPLRTAAENARDAEVRTRATVILARLTQPAGGGKVLRAAAPTLTAGQRITQARVVQPGTNELSVRTRDTAAVIRCDAAGIDLTVTRTADGFETEKYTAKTSAELAQIHPEAYQLYDSVITEMGGGREEGKALRQWFETAGKN